MAADNKNEYILIKKIFNNNSILALDSDKHEVIVMGCGK